MSDAIWYYAKNDEELGPVPTAKLKAMAAAKELLPGDLVWKEGMDDWAPAETLRGLFPATPTRSGPIPITAQATTPAAAGLTPPPVSEAAPGRNEPMIEPQATGSNLFGQPAMGAITPRQIVRLAGWPLLLGGFMLVLWARGCDSLNDRYAAKATAEATLAARRFEQNHLIARQLILKSQQKIREKEEISPADQRDLNRLTDELNDLDEAHTREKESLETGEWAQLKATADNALGSRAVWAYYHEICFVFGALVLSSGLITVGAAGDGPERWICLIMLAIITFSIFVGGAAWLPHGSP